MEAEKIMVVGEKIIEAVKKETERDKKNVALQQTSNACDSKCSGDNYCSDYHDA